MKYAILPVLFAAAGIISAQPLSETIEFNTGSMTPKYIVNGKNQSVTMAASQSNLRDVLLWNMDYYGQVRWAIRLDISGNNAISDEVALTTLQDSSYMAVANIRVSGRFVPLLIRVSDSGNYMWSKTFEYPGYEGVIRSIRQLSDNRIILSGYLESGSTYRTGWLILIDTSGNIVMSRKYVYSTVNVEFFDVKSGQGGKIVVPATIEENASLLIVDSLLEPISSHMYVTGNYSRGSGIGYSNQTGMYYMAGHIDFASNRKGAIFTIDTSGNLIDIQTLDGPGQESFIDILIRDMEGTIFLSGYTSTSDSSRDILIVKMDTAGNVLSQKSAGSSGIEDVGFRMNLDAKNFIWIAGYSHTGNGEKPAAVRFASYLQNMDIECSSPLNMSRDNPSMNDVYRNISDTTLVLNTANISANAYTETGITNSLCSTGVGEYRCENLPFHIRGNTIYFEEGTPWSIFDARGRIIASGRSGAKALRTGAYIVETGNIRSIQIVR